MNSESVVQQQSLLERVSERLAATSTATDQLLLTRWRVLGLCQFIVGGGDGKAAELVIKALNYFVREGAGRMTDAALKEAGGAIENDRVRARGNRPILPQIAPKKQAEVRERLKDYESLGVPGLEKALAALPTIKDRIQHSPMGALMAGIRHRLELVAALAADPDRPLFERQKAGSAILYLDEVHDAITDTLGHIGLLDDDFALRLVLEEVGAYTEIERLHWAEKISALWDDLPFLQGVHLNCGQRPVATTWLDRINSFISYTHALDGAEKPLILVQPTVACSPLHSIVSLIGLLVLDGLTSSEDLLRSLRVGQTYEIDGQFYATFEGISKDLRTVGRLKLKVRECAVYRLPRFADRMIAVPDRRLSSAKTFPKDSDEVIQRFFDWDEAIGAASLSSRVLLVTSRQRATELLGSITSNGVSLLDDGLVKFAGTNPSPDLIRTGLVLVVPSIAVARTIVEQGLSAHAIVVDGYMRLQRGRHDLPFLQMQKPSPPVIVWSTTGYYPDKPPEWLPQHQRLQVTSDDLSYILELDGDLNDDSPNRASLWEAATSSMITKIHAPWTPDEQQLVESIDELINLVRSSHDLPDYWKYQIFSSATMLRTLVAATPARWSDIRDFATSWDKVFKEQWDGLRPRARAQFEQLGRAQANIVASVEQIHVDENSKAKVLIDFLKTIENDVWVLACDRPEQVKFTDRLLRSNRVRNVKPVILRDLNVCEACIVVGWRSYSFGRRLAAHTPRRLVALVDDSEEKRWNRLSAQLDDPVDGVYSLLNAVGHVQKEERYYPSPERAHTEIDEEDFDCLENVSDDVTVQRNVPCIFIWLADESQGKVLERDARVLVESGDHAREKPAYRIAPEDRVILGVGAGRWSPADEFTYSVVEAIQTSHPELVQDVIEWRRALKALQDDRSWTTEQLRDELAKVGIVREAQTIDGWLRLERASPIGPQHIRQELESMWPIICGYTEHSADEIARACGRLRSLRLAAGHALLKRWKGQEVDIGVDDAWLEGLVEQLRQEVQVHEVESVTTGEVPETMLGWWVSHELAERYSRSHEDQESYALAQDDDQGDGRDI